MVVARRRWLGQELQRIKQRCSGCGGSGWVLDCNSVARGPVTLELLPCLIPECKASGRELALISMEPAKLRIAHRNPVTHLIMSVSR